MKEVSKHTMENLQVYKIYEYDVVDSVFDKISKLEEPRWIERKYLQPGRAVNNSHCRYDYCNFVQMPQTLQEFLKTIAPVYDSYFLSDIAINRYKAGDYIGSHRDRHDFRRNLVVSLQDSNDGLYLDDDERFIEDKKGQGVLITGIGPVHSVPPVKSLRYSLIFLYE